MPCIRRNCARQKTGFAERSGQKIVLQRQLPDLGVKLFDIDRWRRSRLALAAENLGSPFKKLRAPGRDLIGMHVILIGQFGQRLLTPDRGKCHFRLECRAARRGTRPVLSQHARRADWNCGVGGEEAAISGI